MSHSYPFKLFTNINRKHNILVSHFFDGNTFSRLPPRFLYLVYKKFPIDFSVLVIQEQSNNTPNRHFFYLINQHVIYNCCLKRLCVFSSHCKFPFQWEGQKYYWCLHSSTPSAKNPKCQQFEQSMGTYKHLFNLACA